LGVVAKLTETVGKQFDARQSAREKELKQLEDQLLKLKAAQSKRTTQKDRIVKDRVQQIINNAEGIGWGGDSPSEGSFQFQAKPLNVEGQLPPYSLCTGARCNESCASEFYFESALVPFCPRILKLAERLVLPCRMIGPQG